ncbi:3-oxoacyl-(acyl-carrier-protein) reductase [Lasiodiplodia theobromae]|uniref:3-oxoacyl-(Acyl-carrier-protein) reductase FabG n=1 Tax=Lasiodiplodia theobromae TaxID=45133 RepID=A0A5N5DJ68_9PEZI|nr:3-oxoacyl-(acyl-carrier-protein) reductase [Lasiodiplodia theobromae]KAB2577371.1 3-oxoacyl-(acyl-carrier-protein) reductase FabG [Lasiodiplodia theobromae]KAF4540380.1 3-oxoacyl-(acyl-carrier-protein) reductase [Lasiodiplodia theobromae]
MSPHAPLSRTILRATSRAPALRRAAARPHIQPYHSTTDTSTLNGHHVLVTGGSRGIGKAIASRFASLGASTTIVGRHADTLQLATHEIVSRSPRFDEDSISHGYVTGDISTKGFWEMLSRSLVLRQCLRHSPSEFNQEKFDPTPLTILVNAAGVTHNALLTRQSAVATEDAVQTNLMGTMWACKILGKALMKRSARDGAKKKKAAGMETLEESEKALRGGVSIVNVSSLLATHGGVGSAAYAASKAGVLGLTRALAGEMGPLGVRVNVIMPGYVETDMTAAMQTVAREKALERIPLKRFGTVEEIAEAAVFLVTNQYANNCVINLDGDLMGD